MFPFATGSPLNKAVKNGRIITALRRKSGEGGVSERLLMKSQYIVPVPKHTKPWQASPLKLTFERPCGGEGEAGRTLLRAQPKLNTVEQCKQLCVTFDQSCERSFIKWPLEGAHGLSMGHRHVGTLVVTAPLRITAHWHSYRKLRRSPPESQLDFPQQRRRSDEMELVALDEPGRKKTVWGVLSIRGAYSGIADLASAAWRAATGLRFRAGRVRAAGREALVVDRLQPMEMIGHQPKERRRVRASWLVDTARRPGRVGHARSGTGERRAYSRRGCGPSPFRCATGCFDATFYAIEQPGT